MVKTLTNIGHNLAYTHGIASDRSRDADMFFDSDDKSNDFFAFVINFLRRLL